VDLDNAAEFIAKGSAALGVGSSLVNLKLLASGDMDELAMRAASFIREVKRGRGG
jgi:2-dehydro-3-deoxyphosphogluconate aldolase/(4S)-4-hydroxy-2-oxoglutarate aldolase